MDTPDSTGRTSVLRTALRRLVLVAFAGTATVIVLLAGEALVSAVGWNSDPHGYGVIFGLLCAAVLAPVALALWMSYRALRRRGR